MLNTDTSPQILCVGRIYCDLVFSGVPRMPSLGSEVFAENVTLHAGGGAFNTAAAFSALGRKTALCGVLPAALADPRLRGHVGVDLVQARPLALLLAQDAAEALHVQELIEGMLVRT